MDLMRAKRKDEERKERKRSRKKKIITRTVCIAGSILLVGGATFGTMKYIKTSGVMERSRVSVTSEHYELNNAEMAYFYVQMEDSFLSSGATYLGYMGVNPNLSLREQEYNGETWFNVLMDSVEKNVTQMLVLLEKARAEGMTLTAEEQAKVDQEADAIDLSHYGEGIKREDVRRAIEMTRLAAKYSEKIQGECVTTEDQWIKHYEENEKDYLYWQQASCTFSYAKNSSGEAAMTEAEAKKYRDELSACKDEESFNKWIRQYFKDAGKTDEEIDKQLASLVAEGSLAASGEERFAWAESAKIGDTFVVEGTDAYTVYQLRSLPARKESQTVDVRHILMQTENYENKEAAKAEAERIYALWQVKPTEDYFAELANQYSEDPGSNTLGGLYESVQSGEMVDTFDAWCFDEKRKSGDHGIVETSYGYHIMYFSGEGLPQWQVDIKAELENDAYLAVYNKLAEEYTVTIDEKLISKVCPDR